jgi:hypothetical protein
LTPDSMWSIFIVFPDTVYYNSVHYHSTSSLRRGIHEEPDRKTI